MRKRRIELQAEVDLLEIWHHIAIDSIPNANRVWERLHAAIERLYEWPGIGHRKDELRRPGLRFYSVDSFVIAYHYDDTTFTIARVVHGARDFKRISKSK